MDLYSTSSSTLVQEFIISSSLDYCNSVLYLLHRLQSVQNAVVRLITRTGRREHTSPVLQELHWLPVRRRVALILYRRRCFISHLLTYLLTYFKLATLMFKSLHGCAPSHLSDTCNSALEASRHLRSSGAITCIIPWSRTRLGDRSFDVAGPRLWNKLPASLRS